MKLFRVRTKRLKLLTFVGVKDTLALVDEPAAILFSMIERDVKES